MVFKSLVVVLDVVAGLESVRSTMCLFGVGGADRRRLEPMASTELARRLHLDMCVYVFGMRGFARLSSPFAIVEALLMMLMMW